MYAKGYLLLIFRKSRHKKAYNGILKQFIRINGDKTISLTKCCSVSGLGPGPGKYVKTPNYRRDGSFEYYISEPVRDNDAKGIGPFYLGKFRNGEKQSIYCILKQKTKQVK